MDLKELAELEKAKAASGIAGWGDFMQTVNQPPGQSVGDLLSKSTRPKSIRDRIAERLQEAMKQADKSSSLRELLELLDKHPEVSRILQLIEELGVR